MSWRKIPRRRWLGRTVTIVRPAIGSAAPPGTPKLNIKKTAAGCASDPSSTDRLCDFKIVVTNYGTGPQPPLLKVTDKSNKPSTFAGARCAP